MSRLIDADALIEDIREHSTSYFADDFAHEWVDKQPTIEPERKKGEWREHIFDGIMGGRPRALMCTQCNAISLYAHNYCPYCGAKMGEPEDIPMEYFESGGR